MPAPADSLFDYLVFIRRNASVTAEPAARPHLFEVAARAGKARNRSGESCWVTEHEHVMAPATACCSS